MMRAKNQYLIPIGGTVILVLILLLVGEYWLHALITGAIFALIWIPLYPYFMKLVSWIVNKLVKRP